MNRSRRLIWIAVIGLALLLSAGFYVRYFLARPTGSGPAGPAVDRTAFQSEWTSRPIQLIGIGDSITAGLGAKSQDHTFFNRLIRNPPDEYDDMQSICLSSVLPKLESKNLAISGSTSRDHLEVVMEKLSKFEPEVFGLVVMTSGGNDLIHSYGRSPAKECAMYGATLTQAEPWIANFQTRLEQLYRRIEECFPGGFEVFLGDIYDPTDGVGDAPSVYLPHWPDGLAIHARYNEVIYQFEKSHKNVHIVPLHRTFLGHGSHCLQFWRRSYVSADPTYWYYSNIEDPNDRGYDAIRRAFLNSISEHSQLRPRGAQITQPSQR